MAPLPRVLQYVALVKDRTADLHMHAGLNGAGALIGVAGLVSACIDKMSDAAGASNGGQTSEQAGVAGRLVM